MNKLLEFININYHPGYMLKKYLRQNKHTQRDLAFCCGVSEQAISMITQGRNRITAPLGFKIAIALGHPTSHWVDLQTKYDAMVWELRYE